MDESHLRNSLKAWIRRRAKLAPDVVLRDDTPILEAGLLTSLDVAQLFLFIESLRGQEVDLSSIEPEVLTNVDTLYAAFLAPAQAAPAAEPAPPVPAESAPMQQPAPRAGARAP